MEEKQEHSSNKQQEFVTIDVTKAVQEFYTAKLPNHFLPLSIFTTIFFSVFGIFAVIYSVKCREAIKYGDILAARVYSKKAKIANLLNVLISFAVMWLLCIFADEISAFIGI